MEKMNNDIYISDENGHEKKMSILFTYHDPDKNRDYVYFFDPLKPEEVLMMEYSQDGNLYDVEDEEEFNHLQEVYEAYLKDHPDLN